MKTTISRRNLVKSMVLLPLGAELSQIPYNNILFKQSFDFEKRQINVKIPPPGPKSIALLEDIKKYIGRSNYTGLYGVGLNAGSGVFIEDIDGNVYLDCLSAASSTLLGYSHDEIAKVYYDSAIKIQQTCFGYSPNRETVEFAKKVSSITPGDFQKKVIIGLSGSDSVDGSIEASRKYTGKKGIISFKNAYHGSAGLSQPASGFRALNEGIYDLNSPDFVKVQFPLTPEEGERVLKSIESILSFGKIAAVLVEVIQGDGGTLLAPAGFFKQLRLLVDEYDSLLICDEVQSGMGRTGKWCACEHEEMIPDIVVLGKGLSAGYAPVSAIIGRKEVLDALVPASQIFTYSGHGPSVSAASRVIDIIMENDLIENSGMIGTRLLKGLNEARKYSDVIVEVRGRGLMIGIEINLKKDLLASKIFAFRCLEKGVYFGYIGDKQRVIRVLPPMILNQDECDTIIRVVHETAEEMQNNQIPDETVERVKKYTLGW